MTIHPVGCLNTQICAVLYSHIVSAFVFQSGAEVFDLECVYDQFHMCCKQYLIMYTKLVIKPKQPALAVHNFKTHKINIIKNDK